MSISDEEFEALAKENCPLCRKGNAVRQRSDTLEYVHDSLIGKSFTHSLCWSNGMRQARKVETANG